MFDLPYRGVTQINWSLLINPYSGKDPQFRFFYVVKGGAELSLEPEGSRWPSTQNNLHAKVAIMGWPAFGPYKVYGNSL